MVWEAGSPRPHPVIVDTVTSRLAHEPVAHKPAAPRAKPGKTHRMRLPLKPPLIEIENVTVRRGQTRILDDISLVIAGQRHTAILGPNGSGKSSLLKLLTRDFYPSVESDGGQGSVRILGREDWEVLALRRQMGIVTPMLDAEFSRGRTGRMTVAQAVASGFTATRLLEFGPQLDSAQHDAVDQAIETVQLTELRDRQVATLSTGERRRTLIARAIVHQPEVFVLDEPTSGLDISAKATFLEILDALSQQTAMTLMLVTHHIDEIPPAVGHVVLLDRGRVAFDGDKQQALTNPRLSALFALPLAIGRTRCGWYECRRVPDAPAGPADRESATAS
jgi:iron complex transport system ATP-binding protein